MNGPTRPPSRRGALLSLGALGASALAGCLGSPFGDSCTAGTDFSMEAATDERIVAYVSTPLADLPPVTRRVAADALDDGEATYRGFYEPDVHDEYVRGDSGTTG